jgi:hypothetical protein
MNLIDRPDRFGQEIPEDYDPSVAWEAIRRKWMEVNDDWDTWPVESHTKESAELVEITEVKAEESYERTMRKPIIYSPQTDTAYVGPYGAHHVELIWAAFGLDRGEPEEWLTEEYTKREMVAMTIEDYPGNLGVVLEDKKIVTYFDEPHDNFRRAVMTHFPGFKEEVYGWSPEDQLDPLESHVKETSIDAEYVDYEGTTYDWEWDTLRNPIFGLETPEGWKFVVGVPGTHHSDLMKALGRERAAEWWPVQAGFYLPGWAAPGYERWPDNKGMVKWFYEGVPKDVSLELSDYIESQGWAAAEPVESHIRSIAEEESGIWFEYSFFIGDDKLFYGSATHPNLIRNVGFEGEPQAIGWISRDLEDNDQYYVTFYSEEVGEVNQNRSLAIHLLQQEFDDIKEISYEDFNRRWSHVKEATEVVYAPTTEYPLNSNRVPVVYDPELDVVYIGNRGGLHPDLFEKAIGEAWHMSQVPMVDKAVYKRFSAGIFDEELGGGEWADPFMENDMTWMYGPPVPPEVDEAVRNFVMKESHEKEAQLGEAAWIYHNHKIYWGEYHTEIIRHLIETGRISPAVFEDIEEQPLFGWIEGDEVYFGSDEWHGSGDLEEFEKKDVIEAIQREHPHAQLGKEAAIIDVRPWTTQQRSIAYMSDGENIYLGFSHPQIVHEVYKEGEDDKTEGKGMLLEKLREGAPLVFGYADIDEDTGIWRAHTMSGNFSWINAQTAGWDEKVRREVVAWLNGQPNPNR